LGESASQGILEALAVFGSVVGHQAWARELATCNVTLHIQSDSLVALALTQRLANSTPGLNFIGAELAIACEAAGIEDLKATHIPGAANTTADYLSRPTKQRTMPFHQNWKGYRCKTRHRGDEDFMPCRHPAKHRPCGLLIWPPKVHGPPCANGC